MFDPRYPQANTRIFPSADDDMGYGRNPKAVRELVNAPMGNGDPFPVVQPALGGRPGIIFRTFENQSMLVLADVTGFNGPVPAPNIITLYQLRVLPNPEYDYGFTPDISAEIGLK